MKPISERSPQEIRQELQEEFAGDVAAMAENYARTVPEMEDLLENGGITYRKEHPSAEDGLVDATFDVCFNPMTNIRCKVKDPNNLTEEETETIIEKAIFSIRENIPEKISAENVEFIRPYTINGKEIR